MKRIKSLSKLRNTLITASGGHGIIQVKNKHEKIKNTDNKQYQEMVHFPKGATATSLYHLPWEKRINSVEIASNSVSFRLGTNLINGSDFESFNLFHSPERAWEFNKEDTSINSYGANSQSSIKITVKEKNTSRIGMQSFRRVFKADNPMTIQAKFKTSAAIKVNFYWQGRKHGEKLFHAYENAEKHLISSLSLTPHQDWQTLESDFNSPRIGYKSYRVFAEIQLLEDEERTAIDVDDFALIEWQSSFSFEPKINNHNFLIQQASFLGVNKSTTSPITVYLE